MVSDFLSIIYLNIIFCNGCNASRTVRSPYPQIQHPSIRLPYAPYASS